MTRGLSTATRKALRSGSRAVTRAATRTVTKALKQSADANKPPPGGGLWLHGLAVGAAGVRRFRVYRPPGIRANERVPLLVMLHGCGQDARSFAMSTRMNRVADRERFLVLYPEQDRLSNAQGCWNWFDTTAGRAFGEAELIMNAIDQVCLLYPVDPARVAVAGLSAGASMAVLLVSRHPERFQAVVMHSGIPPGAAYSTLSAVGAMHGLRGAGSLKATPATMAESWPALLVIHGDRDGVVAASNGQAAVNAWAEAAGARKCAARSMQRGKRYPMTVTDFKCGTRTVARLVGVESLGHAWSGGAASSGDFSDARGPDASRMVWAFVAKQFLRA
ncbi:extracellular catalytic domain type 1 short-chain-length polyhydroxyalkanoate depolymerase [Nitrincola sp. A-D6]|uniref:extracellular catalytic domain type 1 short-chain-length polyhydroxyalkanoate depolymerase n=1 Tax=Nitrincola sp. A-D6 TaxID=1545442 RepID=UPI0009DF8748|nr:PHB depolymerase family esterase [Nitrincola sp. A-D6]